MNDKLDVFEILSQKNTETQKRGQEQQHVPDPDFNDAIKLLDINYSTQETEKKAEPDPEPKKEPVPMKKKKPAKSRVSVKMVLKKHVLVLLLAVAVLLLLFTFVLNISAVAGPSMEPALEDGDRVVINRLARNFDAGDIIVFETGGGERLVKRIVADNGDVVSITADKGFCLNGKEADEDYIHTETAITDIRVAYPVIVDEDEYFVLGDNRTNSKDSRNADIGLVKKEDIIGKVILSIRSY